MLGYEPVEPRANLRSDRLPLTRHERRHPDGAVDKTIPDLVGVGEAMGEGDVPKSDLPKTSRRQQRHELVVWTTTWHNRERFPR